MLCSPSEMPDSTTDKFTPEKRSKIMSSVKGRDTGPEKAVRSMLHAMGYRFRLHEKRLPGKPDIVLPRHQKVIFVHGCFWHGHQGCSRSKRPKSNVDFWNHKIDGNIRRDAEIQEKLRMAGWEILTVWQCQIRDKELLESRLRDFMKDEKDSSS